MQLFIDLIYDSHGNIRGIGGVWEVPDDFTKEEEYSDFISEWAPKQKHGKKGKILQKALDKQYAAWRKHMNKKFKKIDFKNE